MRVFIPSLLYRESANLAEAGLDAEQCRPVLRQPSCRYELAPRSFHSHPRRYINVLPRTGQNPRNEHLPRESSP